MGKISAKGVIYALLPTLLFQFSSPVAAADIIYFESTSECSGAGVSFSSVGPQVCCAVSARDGGSVLVTSASNSVTSRFFRGGACSAQVGTGHGNNCLVGGNFTGAFWFNGRRQSLLADSQTCDSECDSLMKPTGIVYTEDGMNGKWILKTADATEMHSQMQEIPDAGKVEWLQSQGATYEQL